MKMRQKVKIRERVGRKKEMKERGKRART